MQTTIEIIDFPSEGQPGPYRVRCAANDVAKAFNALIEDKVITPIIDTHEVTFYQVFPYGEERPNTWPLLTTGGRFDLNPVAAK